MSTPRVPFNVPFLTGREQPYLMAALESRAHCGNRGFAERCAAQIREHLGGGAVFLTPSCTAAMEMGAILAGLEPGDEVIMPSYTFSSTANAVALRGARPVFCDVEPGTMNMDVDLVEQLITGRTRMVLPIDYAGIPCAMERLLPIANRHGLVVMQDAAQSYGSRHAGGAPCGRLPELAAFSFHETKNLSCGEGGALIVNREDWIERAEIIQEKGTNRAMVLRGMHHKYGWVDLGSSFLLADLLAAMLLAQLEACADIIQRRAAVTHAYQKLLEPYENQGCLGLPHPPAGAVTNHHAYFVVFETPGQRRQFLDLLREEGVTAYIGYVPLHAYDMGRKLGYQPEDLPHTQRLAERIVRLPLYADLGGEDLEHAIAAMTRTLRTLFGF